MAEHILETTIRLRYATFARWMNSDLILQPGEPAIAIFSQVNTLEEMSNSAPENTPPAVGIKIGDGRSYFYELPWVQGIAADVYNWAKQVSKPIYTANEIQGLQTFIEQYSGGGSGSGSGTAVTRQYQIYEGTDQNENHYFLRYRDNDEEGWIIDYNHSIDLSGVVALMDWIGNDLERFTSLGNRTDNHITYRLEQLDYPTQQNPIQIQAPTDHYFITSVSQVDGLLQATKGRVSFEDIQGTLGVPQGGTGAQSFESGEVLIGNGENAFRTMEISTTVENTRTLVYNYAVKAYIDAAVAGLTGAMHFIGEATVPVSGAVNPQISDYDFAHAQAGDVILYERKEYVWTGSNWRLLGDEGSYAVKGSIRDADIDADAAIQMSKIADLLNVLATKVDKEDGKGLSSNDYTSEDRQKLAGIDDGAQVNVIENVFLNDHQIFPATINGNPKSIDLHVKEFSDDDRTKLNRLDTIEDGAQVNLIEHITVDGTEVNIGPNKTIALTTDPHTEHINVIEEIFVNNTQFFPDQNKAVHLELNESVLGLHILEGAIVPGLAGAQDETVNINSAKQLILARIAKTGNIVDLIQDANTYVILDCGTSTSDSH